MSGWRTLAVIWRVSRQVAEDRRLIVLALGVPVVIMTILALVIRAEPATPRVTVVAEGPLRAFVPRVRQHLAGGRFEVVDVAPDEADAALRDGRLDAVFRFGADFLAARERGEQPRLEVRVLGGDPSTLREVMQGVRERMAALPRLLAGLMPADCPAACRRAVPVPPRIDVVRLLGERDDLDYYVAAVAPLVAFFFGYLLTAMAFLRERTGGTLERISATPLRPAELTIGYLGGFLSLALVQAAVVLGFMVWALGVHNAGSWWSLAALLVLTAVSAEGLGIFLSTLARTEFQVVQFIPLVVFPQVLLCGLVWPVDSLPPVLRELAWAMPLTYGTEGIRRIMLWGDDLGALPLLGALLGFAALAAALAATTMRRRAC